MKKNFGIKLWARENNKTDYLYFRDAAEPTQSPKEKFLKTLMKDILSAAVELLVFC